MNIQRIQTIIDKEWAEVFKHRMVLFTVVFLPLIFTILPIGILMATNATSGSADLGNADDLPPSMRQACGEIDINACLQIYIVNQFLTLYMLMPLAIPISIAAYSIVGEKTTRSLEPLLATPLSTEELLTAKAIAAVVPAIVATWGGFVLFVIALRVVASPIVFAGLLNPTWLVAIFIVGPLLAVLAVNFAIIVSSRVNDPRAAEQISMVIILPLILTMFGQIAGVLVLNVQFMLLAALALAVIDVGLVYVGARLFQRETILTKWK